MGDAAVDTNMMPSEGSFWSMCTTGLKRLWDSILLRHRLCFVEERFVDGRLESFLRRKTEDCDNVMKG